MVFPVVTSCHFLANTVGFDIWARVDLLVNAVSPWLPPQLNLVAGERTRVLRDIMKLVAYDSSVPRRSGTPVYWILECSLDTKTFMFLVTRNESNESERIARILCGRYNSTVVLLCNFWRIDVGIVTCGAGNLFRFMYCTLLL